jgi:hypothetical protein
MLMFSKKSKKNLQMYLYSLIVFAVLGLAFANAETASAYYEVIVGTQSGGYSGSTGGGAVYRHEGGTTWTNISAGTEIGQAVMDLIIFDGALYACTQTQAGHGGRSGYGQVWRYDGGTTWTQVGQMDTSVMDMVIYRDELHAVTTDWAGDVANVYRYDGTPCSWTLVGTDTSRATTGYQSAIISDVSGADEIIIGDLSVDRFYTYSPETGLVFREDHSGSCVWDFEEYMGAIYSGHFWGPIYKTTNGRNWTMTYEDRDRHFWTLKTYQGSLYVGSSGYSYQISGRSGRLDILDTSTNTMNTIWEYSANDNTDGIIQLAAAPDESLLFIGTGIKTGFYSGDGLAEVWTYDGTNLNKISPDDFFGGGVQSLLADDLVTIEVAVDIKPKSCPNPVSVRKKGVLPVAILGTADFDVTQIDPSTVKLNGVAAQHYNIEDTATPPVDSSCTTEGADGFADLVLMFDAQEILQTINASDDDVLALKIRGYLTEEVGRTAIRGSDEILFLDRGTPETSHAQGPEIQWATTATASSQYSPSDWSAMQATGEPNTVGCGDQVTAWAPLSSGSDLEWIELGFDFPVKATGLQVHETFESGFIYQVDLIDVDGVSHTVWTGTDNTPCPGWFELSFKRTNYVVQGVKLYTQVNGWEEVDAVALISN